MNLEKFYSENKGYIQFTREQASQFAKCVAGDFNPIHDPDSKRFCVPGDLLFACSLKKYGLSENMSFRFSGMVGSEVVLNFLPTDQDTIPINNSAGKEFLRINRSGKHTENLSLIDSLIEQYVKFSGYTFPHLLVPLMVERKMMINPLRPLVIYESMHINLQTLDADSMILQRTGAELAVKGKRGDATLNFSLLAKGEMIGNGCKTMLLSGLKPYNQDDMNSLVERYLAAKSKFS